MIVRILGEGQWDVADDQLDALNRLDAEVESAVEAGEQERFAVGLAALLDAVRASGTRLPDESLQDSDLILPPSDASIDEVRALLTEADDGLIPG
jgi:hypothetical protein